MSLLARKINRSHWPDNVTDVSDIGADAITISMRTSHNAMSVYEIPSTMNIDDAFLAISSNFQRLESFDIVIMEEQDLVNLHINCIRMEGTTPVEDLKNAHLDISSLCYSKLGTIADYIACRILENHSIRRTKGQLKDILNQAIQGGRLDPNTLDPRLREYLQ